MSGRRVLVVSSCTDWVVLLAVVITQEVIGRIRLVQTFVADFYV